MVVALPPDLRRAPLHGLRDALLRARGALVDGADVRRAGAASLQVIASALVSGHVAGWKAASDALVSTASRLGLREILRLGSAPGACEPEAPGDDDAEPATPAAPPPLEAYRDLFLQELLELHDRLKPLALRMMASLDDVAATLEVMHPLHTLKGSAATFGQPALSRLAHQWEGEMVEAGRRGPRLDERLVEAFFDFVEALPEVQATVGRRADAGAFVASLTRQLAQVREGRVADGWSISLTPSSLTRGMDVASVAEALAGLGTVTVTCDTRHLPGLDGLDPEACALDWTFHVRGTVTEPELTSLLEWADPEARRAVRPLQALPPLPRAGAEAQGFATVPVGLIRAAMLGGAEQVVAHDRCRRTSDPAALAELEVANRHLWRALTDLRLQPLATTFGPLRRRAQELAAQLGKRLRVVVRGGRMRVARELGSVLIEALRHLVRNSVDHGIEPPHERVRAGKPVDGTLELAASWSRGTLRISVADDGAGVDPGRLWARAWRFGLDLPPEPSDDPELLLRILSTPGFTSQSEASDISGRGVGVDAVVSAVHRAGGEVRLENRPGAGLTVVMTFPADYELVDGALVEAGGRLLCVPGAEPAVGLEAPPLGRWAGAPAHPVACALSVGDAHRVALVGVERVVERRKFLVYNLELRGIDPGPFVGATPLETGRLAYVVDVRAILDAVGTPRDVIDDDTPPPPAPPRHDVIARCAERRVRIAHDRVRGVTYGTPVTPAPAPAGGIDGLVWAAGELLKVIDLSGLRAHEEGGRLVVIGRPRAERSDFALRVDEVLAGEVDAPLLDLEPLYARVEATTFSRRAAAAGRLPGAAPAR